MRGPARHEAGFIVLDVTRATKYSPDYLDLKENLAAHLASVDSPRSAVRFVERCGLLTVGPFYPEDVYIDGIPRDQIPASVKEPYTLLEEHAQRFREVLEVVQRIRSSEYDRGMASMDWLRQWAVVRLKPTEEKLAEAWDIPPGEWTDGPLKRMNQNFQRTLESRLDLLEEAMGWVARVMENGLTGVAASLAPERISPQGTAGSFRLDLWSENLLGYCYLALARQLTGERALLRCENPKCGRVFAQLHGHQRYCSPRCSSVVRQSRLPPREAGTRDHAARKAQKKGTV